MQREQPTLGLRRGRVELRSHHEEWRHAFQRERERLAEIFKSGEFSVEHVGSTSVKGLPAKPILDVALLVRQSALIPQLKNYLCSKEYLYRGNHGEHGGHLFILESLPGIRTIHMHVILEGDPQWNAYLKFRGILRSNDNLRARYGRLKSNLAAALPNERASYTAAKAEFIQEVLSSQLNG